MAECCIHASFCKKFSSLSVLFLAYDLCLCANSFITFVAFFAFFSLLLDTSKRVRLDKLSGTSIGGSSSKISMGFDYMSHMKVNSKPYTRKDGKVVMERASAKPQPTNNESSSNNPSNNGNADAEPYEFD